MAVLAIAVVTHTTLADIAAAQGTFDIATVPRPESAVAVADRSSSSSVTYVHPASVPATIAATDSALRADGWLPYAPPDQLQSRRYKKGRVGLYVSFSMSEGKADRARISYSHNNAVTANVPFPDDATDIVYDEQRPYLRCVTRMSVEAAAAFFVTGLSAEGWSPLDAAAIAARWPQAKLADAPANGHRAYFAKAGRNAERAATMLTLQRDAEGRTLVDLRVAPFALPQELPFYQEFAGLPASQHYKRSGASGSADSPRREATALVIAELPVVLAFYRRELTSRGYQEQASGAVIGDASARVTFMKPDETAVLDLRALYDMTDVRLVAQISQAAMAQRARAKQEADAKWMRDARKEVEDVLKASEAKRAAAVAAVAAAPVETLRARAGSETPIPLPDSATSVSFDGEAGKLEFTVPATPKSVAAFYRTQLAGLGWKAARTVIDKPNMVRLDFNKGVQKIGFTIMLFGDTTRVSADGSGLQVPADPTREKEKLEAVDVSGFPVPKTYSMSAPGTWAMKGSSAVFRRDYNAMVPSDIGSVLAFYRRELAARGWRERAEAAAIKPTDVLLSFTAPEGPATLRLGRKGKETTIALVVRNPEEARKAGLLPPAGMARLVLGNLDDAAVTLNVAQKTFKLAPGTGNSKTPDGPMLDVKPGTYRYVLKSPGKPDKTESVTLSADDAWGLMAGPGGVLALQMY